MAEPSSLCMKRDGLRYIFDLGEAHLLVLSSFVVTLHIGGYVPWSFNGGRPVDSPPLEMESGLDVEVELFAETQTDVGDSENRKPSPALIRRNQIPGPVRPRNDGNTVSISGPRPRCGPQHIVQAKVASPKRAGDVVLGRMFALKVRCQLPRNCAVVLRQLELYGTLLHLPDDVKPHTCRDAFMFDNASHGRTQT